MKPGNVIIDQHGEPFLLDFGLVRDLSAHSLTEEYCQEATLDMTSQDEDLMPGMNDTYYTVWGDPEAVKREMRVVMLKLTNGAEPG